MSSLTDFANYIFQRIIKTAEELTEEELDWKPISESNSVRWMLTHITRIAYLLIPQVLTDTHNSGGWDDDYEKQPHSLSELKKDLKEAHNKVVSLLKEMDKERLNEEIMIWGSMRPRKEALFVLLGELLHHNGQIAMMRGLKNRLNQ